jgi:hypothetical protein
MLPPVFQLAMPSPGQWAKISSHFVAVMTVISVMNHDMKGDGHPITVGFIWIYMDLYGFIK